MSEERCTRRGCLEFVTKHEIATDGMILVLPRFTSEDGSRRYCSERCRERNEEYIAEMMEEKRLREYYGGSTMTPRERLEKIRERGTR